MNNSRIMIGAIAAVVALLVLFGGAASAEILFNDVYLSTSGLHNEGIQTIHSILYVGDTCFAYLDDESLRACQSDGSLMLFCKLPTISLNPYVQPTMQELTNIVTNIATDGEVLYGWNVYSGQFGIINKNGIEWGSVKLRIEGLHPYESVDAYRIAGSCVKNDTLFVFVSLTEYVGRMEYRLYAYNLLSGQEQTYTITNAVGMCSGENNQIFLLCKDEKWSIQILDTMTGEIFPHPLDMTIIPIDANVCGLTYCKEKDLLYFACNGTVYAGAPEGQPYSVGTVNTNGCMSESAAWILSDGRYALCSMVGLNVVSIDMNKNEQSRLVVQGLELTKANSCFQTMYPDTILSYIDEDISADDLALRFLTRDDSVDIYRLRIDSTFTNVKEKGFFAPLSDSVILNQQCYDMPAEVLDAITDKTGELFAYPASLRISTFGINLDYWNLVFGDQLVPRTMEQLLDAWILFEEKYADEYPLLEMWYGFDKALLCRELLINYVQTNPNPAKTFATDPSLRAVLEKIEKIAELREIHQRTLTEWSADESEGRATIFSLFAERDAMYRSPTFYLETQENMVYDISIFQYSPLSLSWTEEPYQTNGTLTVYVINPYSKNLREAICYIERASQVDVNPYLYYSIHLDIQEPYENPSFRSKIDRVYSEIGYIEELLQRDDLSPSDRIDLEAMLEYQKRIIQKQNQLKWLITPDTIKEERALLSRINLNLSNVYLTAMVNSENIERLCNRFANENISVDLFIRELASDLYMIDQEMQ